MIIVTTSVWKTSVSKMFPDHTNTRRDMQRTRKVLQFEERLRKRAPLSRRISFSTLGVSVEIKLRLQISPV